MNNKGVVYKVINPGNEKNKKINSRIKRNIEHVRYIAEREGTELGENGHGLIGHIEGIEDIEKADLKDILQRVGDSTRKNIKVWQTVISLTEEEAVKNNLTDREHWNEIVKSKLSVIQEQYNIEYKDLNYVFSYHNEEGHPHIHLVFWDNRGEQKVENNRVSYGKIRNEFAKEIYKTELSELYEQKNQEKKEIKDKFMSFTEENEIKQQIKEITPHLLNERVINKKLRENPLKDLVVDLGNLKEERLTSFKYKFLKPEEKEKVDKIIKEILKTSSSCNKSYNNYIESHMKSKELLSKNQEYLKKEKEKCESQIKNILGNQVLKFTKELKFEEFKNFKEEKKEYIVGNFVNSINSLLSALAEEEEVNHRRNLRLRGELSKQAKRELALNMKDKSNIDWNM